MRILIVGATGTIASAAAAALRGRHDLVLASQQKSPEAVDIMDPASIRALLTRIGRVDAAVNAAGRAASSRSASSLSPPRRWRRYLRSVEGGETGQVIEPTA